VHTAPGHGRDDFDVWTANARSLAARGIDTRIPYTVDGDGFFTDEAPGFTGKRVITDKGAKGDANEAVIAALRAAGMIIARARLTHQYPHSWRSKKPVIFRNTPQWFIAMDKDMDRPGDTLRNRALEAIKVTRWVPPQGQNRITGMIESKPDWVVSRQRAWGVPIAVFVDAKGEVLRDPKVNERIAAAIEAEGADAWFTSDASRFLGNDYDPARWEKVTDILDVWFDSGSTHAFVLEPRGEWPASLYLEGSDQHRGWFHSSLLESCGTRGRAPYEGVLTHGFVLAESGDKMSKSLGNVVAPQDVIAKSGADILRIWVAASDYSQDLRIGPEILKQHEDTYRRLRNTFRYLLGALDGFAESERIAHGEMPELERFILHRLWELDALVRRSCDDYDFHALFTALHNFCAVELSAFYFDIRKDSLYCDRPDAPRRRAARTVMAELYSCLTAWLAPILCFTAEEAWLARNPGEGESVHLRGFPAVPMEWRDDDLATKWDRVREVRRVVTGRLEKARAEKAIGSSLEAHPRLFVRDHAIALPDIDWAEVCITSDIELVDAMPPADAFTLPDVFPVGVEFAKAEGQKCARCWRVLPEVGTVPAHPELCERCADAVEHAPAAAK
jgi:isoleucyl-tRNA synthetase